VRNHVVDILKERIKEISCLYDVSTIANQIDKNFSQILQEIVERVAQAWYYPEDAICVIQINDERWYSRKPYENGHFQSEPIYHDSKQIGIISVIYPQKQRNITDFLKEELKLLKKLSYDLSHIYERKIKNEREINFLKIAQRQDRVKILEEITAGIAHELNTPLGSILGFAQLIMESESNSQTTEDARKIMNSALHAREIVKKLMYFSSEIPQSIDKTNITKLIRETIELLKPNLNTKNLIIHVESPENPVIAEVDPIQITQVLFNLILNSIYAAFEGTEIRICIKEKNDSFIIELTDQGVGIEPSIQERIFDPFFTTKPIGQGSGLGLSVCYGIIKSYNGQILVASAVNEGTTFYIELPKKHSS
jgi:two-component system NtrC family sensor kinase